MKRHGRIHVSFRGHAQDSYASLELPVEEVVSALADSHLVSPKGVIEIEGLYANGDGVRVTIERVAKSALSPTRAEGWATEIKIVSVEDVRGVTRDVQTSCNGKRVVLSLLASRGARGWLPPRLSTGSLLSGWRIVTPSGRMVTPSASDLERVSLSLEDVDALAAAARSLFEAYAREFGGY